MIETTSTHDVILCLTAYEEMAGAGSLVDIVRSKKNKKQYIFVIRNEYGDLHYIEPQLVDEEKLLYGDDK